jgi:hypothetical protein
VAAAALESNSFKVAETGRPPRTPTAGASKADVPILNPSHHAPAPTHQHFDEEIAQVRLVRLDIARLVEQPVYKRLHLGAAAGRGVGWEARVGAVKGASKPKALRKNTKGRRCSK